ncbi:MAG: hypothetical protein HFJ34_01480 [Clostridia bacterium]|nr:hypothetical protein [Clostridia bacterium]
MKDFFERAIALRDTIDQSSDPLKGSKLDILSQLVGQVFYNRTIPNNFIIQSTGSTYETQTALAILNDLGIEGEITMNKTFTPSYQITVANIWVPPIP